MEVLLHVFLTAYCACSYVHLYTVSCRPVVTLTQLMEVDVVVIEGRRKWLANVRIHPLHNCEGDFVRDKNILSLPTKKLETT